ncbi:MAG: DUF1824 family protein [Microcoleaceae cyanobacterium]
MNSTSPIVQAAQQLLEEFTCVKTQSFISSEKVEQVQAALKSLAQDSEYQMFGICADSLEEAFTTLHQYLQAFNYSTIVLDQSKLSPVEGAVYLKFNGRAQSFYAASYAEQYRGVLVSYQSPESKGFNGIYGHFPLDLFA